MPRPRIASVLTFEDTATQLMARVLGPTGVVVEQADFAAISRRVFLTSDGVEVESEDALVIANVIFDTLQTDARWTVDATGYNFRDDCPGTRFPNSGAKYRVEYKFTPNVGEIFYAGFDVSTVKLYQS